MDWLQPKDGRNAGEIGSLSGQQSFLRIKPDGGLEPYGNYSSKSTHCRSVPVLRVVRIASADSLKEKWRRGQESNLHSLAAGGFQDRCNTIMRPLRIRQSVIYRRLFQTLNQCQEPDCEGGHPTNGASSARDSQRSGFCACLLCPRLGRLMCGKALPFRISHL